MFFVSLLTRDRWGIIKSFLSLCFFLSDHDAGAEHQKHTGDLRRRDSDVQRENRVLAEGDRGGREVPGEVHQRVSPPGHVPDVSGERAGEVQEDHRERRQQVNGLRLPVSRTVLEETWHL